MAFVHSPFLPLTHPMSSGGQTCPPPSPPPPPPPLSLSLSTKMPTKFSPSKGMTMFALPPLFYLSLFAHVIWHLRRARRSTKIWPPQRRMTDALSLERAIPSALEHVLSSLRVSKEGGMTSENSFLPLINESRKTNCFRAAPFLRLFTAAAASTTQVQMLPAMQKSLVKTAFSSSSFSSSFSPLQQQKPE